MNPYLLLVEDDQAAAYLTRRALEENGISGSIVTVHDGEEALHFLQAHGAYSMRKRDNPTLILLDLKLPKISGLDLLKTLRAIPDLALIPVVVFSASGMESDREQAHAIGISKYIVKPIDFSELLIDMSKVCKLFDEQKSL